MKTPVHPTPWYLRTYRWGQTNLTEIDPRRYDADWWRDYWKRTRVQGVIVNAGGIVAFYPSAHPLHHRAVGLGDRDFFDEITRCAHEEGLAVLARMDSNRAHAPFYEEHPDWFAVDADARPYRAGDLYVACVSSPYYDDYLPSILREIATRSHPEGFTDNSWSGLERSRICHCDNCARRFRDTAGLPLPRRADWDDHAYRRWIEWGYARRLEIWDQNDRVTREAGGPDCRWIGMNSGDVAVQSERFRDLRAICERAPIVMLDWQARRAGQGLWSNCDAGKLVHGVLGWDRLIPESTAMYGAGRPTFRAASKPEAEVRLWALEGFAGGIQPWWHHVAAYHEDRRQYRPAESLFAWHEANEKYLVEREPVAAVGIVWSQRSTDFHGREAPEERSSLPSRGVAQAMVAARIPYVPVHIDDVGSRTRDIRVLVLPNVGALSDAQCERVRAFVAAGGTLIATGETSRYDEWGDARPDFALSDLFGAHATDARRGTASGAATGWEAGDGHTYLRLVPELRAGVAGPHIPDEPAVRGERHPALEGFEETDILPFGGRIEVVAADDAEDVHATFVPAHPIYPPETAWMREPATSTPALIVRPWGRGRVAYLPADVDRCFARDNLPDHGRLLANLARWGMGDGAPLDVSGRGLIDCELYRQHDRRLVLHLVNLTNPAAWRPPATELIPVGPLTVRVRIPDGARPHDVRLLVAGDTLEPSVDGGWACFAIPSITDHEVAVVEYRGTGEGR